MTTKSLFTELMIWGAQVEQIKHFEMNQYNSFDDVYQKLADYKVLIINTTELNRENVLSISDEILKSSLNLKIILFKNNLDYSFFNWCVSFLNPVFVFKSSDLDQKILSTAIIESIKSYDYNKQNEKFYQLFEEQGQKLSQLNQDLEEQVLNKNISLKRAQKRLLSIKDQLEILYECIVGIQKTNSLPEIEDFLTEKLSLFLDIKWVRALVTQNEIYNEVVIIENQKKFKVFGTPLQFDKKNIGHIYYAKSGKSFQKKNEAFLLQISELVSIKINQLIHFADLAVTRSQWEQTFRAIQHQVTIINSDYDLSNTNFTSQNKIKNKKCYQILFQKDSPCENCQLGKRFETQNKTSLQWFAVTSQELKNSESNKQSYINIYKDITEQKNIESQILENTKLTDLGILAGSLAHELNNPLGGIITFLQLMLSDFEQSPPSLELKSDIEDILGSAQDCKNLIQMILENVRHNRPLELS